MGIDPLHELEQLRRHRGPRAWDQSIRPLVGAAQASAQKTHRKLGRFIDLWLELVPEGLCNQTRVLGLRAGVVQVAVFTASAKYELDRLLRSGLLHTLRRRYPGTLAKVKLQLGASVDER